MKIRFTLLIVLLLCILFSGCGIGSDLSESGYKPNDKVEIKDPANAHPWSVSYNLGIDLETYLLDGNAEAIADLFCDKWAVDVEDVQSALNFIDGKIEYIDHKALESGMKEMRNGIYTLYTYAGRRNIHTDNGKEYIIYFSGVAVWEGHPSVIGLERIEIVLAEDRDIVYNLGYGSAIN